MFLKIKRNLKESIGVFITFFAICFFACVSIRCVLSSMQIIINSNEYLSDKFKIVEFKDQSKITKNEFIEAIESINGIILYENFIMSNEDESKIRGCGIYFNESIPKKPPIYEGSFFSIKDSTSDTPTVIIGKNLLGRTQIVNDTRYLVYNKVFYKVIGIMGYKNINSHYDDEFIINLKAYIINDNNFSVNLSTFFWKIDNVNGNVNETLRSIYNKLKVVNPYFQMNETQITNSKTYSPLSWAIHNTSSIIIIVILIILSLLFNVINITYLWVYNRQKDIGVRKAYGATNKRLILVTILKYQFIAIMASIMALLVLLFLEKHTSVLNILYDIKISKYILTSATISSLVFALFIGFIATIIPVKSILKMNANDIIRGRMV